jgi:ribonuclease HI
VLECAGRTKELSGGEPATTNNRMELQAAINALAALREPCQVEVFTDSQYLREGITRWISGWKARGWRTLAKQPVKNEDLWRALDTVAAIHRVQWRWLKGHAGHSGNERSDVLAGNEIARIKREFTGEQLREMLTRFKSAVPAGAILHPGLFPQTP